MLRRAAVSAAVWLLAVFSAGPSLAAEYSPEPSVTLCSRCFYRQTPPRGASAGTILHPRCHSLPGGQTLATLSRPTCDTAVFSAFHLKHGWTEERGGEASEEPVADYEEDKEKVPVPSLLKEERHVSHTVSSTDSPLQRWDATVTSVVKSRILPQCSTLGGGVYVLIGAGGLRSAHSGDEACETKPLWSAVCCSLPEERSGFSVGLLGEPEEGVREVSVAELQQILGLEEIFFEGCGEVPDGGAVNQTELKKPSSNVTEVRSEVAGEVNSEKKNEKEEVTITAKDSADVVVQTRINFTHDTPVSVVNDVEFNEEDSNSSSTLLFLLSCSLSILKAPLHPVFSTITEFPGQVTYVLQEELGVLSALPGDFFALLHLFASDFFSWTNFAAEMLFGIGEMCFYNLYFCTSSMGEVLFDSCQTGIYGLGTLAGDTVGIFGDAFDNVWSVAKFFGGRLWDQSEGFLGTVMSEMGSQAQAVGGGLGRLTRKSGSGVCNVFKMGGGLIIGVVEMAVDTVVEVIGQSSEGQVMETGD